MKRKKYTLLFSLALLAVTVGGALLYFNDRVDPVASSTPRPVKVDDSLIAPRQDEGTAGGGKKPQADADNSEPKAKSTGAMPLVRFESPSAKALFLKENRLSLADVNYIDELDVYRIDKVTVTPTGGSKLYEPQRYRALLTPNDTFYSSQWHLNKVNALPAWNNTMGDESVVVAVIDTGFGLGHEDLDEKWAVNSGESGATASEGSAPNCTSRSLALDKSCNNIDDDGNDYIDDFTGWDFTGADNSVQAGETSPADPSAAHGTFVAGLTAAESSNAQGVSGVSWGSKILPIQALGDTGDGDTVSVALAINYAVAQGVEVINMSLGSDGDDPLVAEQVQAAIDSGVVVVAAAGNDGWAQLSYPANYPGVIAVGATDSSDNRASFSNYSSNLAIVAPGTSSICSTAWTAGQPIDRYICGYSGTSFSSPIVAGAAALLISQNTTLTPAQIKTALTSTATKVAGMGGQDFTTRYGYGRLNTYEALKSISLAAPLGHVLNTHTVSLAAVAGIYRPEMNSTCTSYYVSAQCRVRAINTANNQIVWLANEPDSGSELNTYWNASGNGLTSGTWLVQAFAEAAGKRSLVREESLVVNP